MEAMTCYLRNFYIRRERIRIDVNVDWMISSYETELGLYDNLGSDCLGLYALRCELYLYINGSSFRISDGLTVSRVTFGREKKLNILDNQIYYEVTYHCDRSPVSTPYYSEVEENVDFGLWMSNVLNSEDRKKRFLNAWNKK